MVIVTPTVRIEVTKVGNLYEARSNSVVGRGKDPASAVRDYRAAARNAEEMFPGFFTAETRI